MNAYNSPMLFTLLGKVLVSSSWEWRTPFTLPGKAVMRWQASSLSPGIFQAHCKMFLKVLPWVLPYNGAGLDCCNGPEVVQKNCQSKSYVFKCYLKLFKKNIIGQNTYLISFWSKPNCSHRLHYIYWVTLPSIMYTPSLIRELPFFSLQGGWWKRGDRVKIIDWKEGIKKK